MSKRFPSLSDILPVFAIISILFYGWTMLVFLWKLPGWLYSSSPSARSPSSPSPAGAGRRSR